MSGPRDLPQQDPSRGQKLGCKSLRVDAVFCANSGVSGEGWLQQKSIAA